MEALTAVLVTLVSGVTDPTGYVEFRLCAKVHLVQIVK